MSDRALVEALEEIREVWAGPNAVSQSMRKRPMQSTFASRCTRLQFRPWALPPARALPLQPAVSAAIPNATNEHDAYAEMLRQAKAECDDDYTKARNLCKWLDWR